FKHNFENLDLDFVQKNMLLRITQEFIQNSIKHSRCKNIFIDLNTSDESFWELNIKDDGVGFDRSRITSNGIGLTNMKNRAEIIGADFSLESQKNMGTTLNIILKKQP
ncbi:MAG: ATP-binding protein, partial [Chryseobacterium sp.]